LIGIYIYLKKKINSTKYLPYSEKYDDLEIILCYVLRCFAWFGLGLWCLMPLSTIFQLYRGG
jgi:hypothetical protein